MKLVKGLTFASIVALSAFTVVPILINNYTIELVTFEIGYYRFIGVPLMVSGLASFYWVVFAFAWIGQGTPAPFDPPGKLVQKGLFGYTRNPMYLSAVFILIGEAILFQLVNLALFTVCFWAFFHFYIVLFEEPALALARP